MVARAAAQHQLQCSGRLHVPHAADVAAGRAAARWQHACSVQGMCSKSDHLPSCLHLAGLPVRRSPGQRCLLSQVTLLFGLRQQQQVFIQITLSHILAACTCWYNIVQLYMWDTSYLCARVPCCSQQHLDSGTLRSHREPFCLSQIAEQPTVVHHVSLSAAETGDHSQGASCQPSNSCSQGASTGSQVAFTAQAEQEPGAYPAWWLLA